MSLSSFLLCALRSCACSSSSGGLSGIGTGPRNGGGLPGRRSPWGPLAGVSQYLVALRPGSGPRQQRRLVGMLREYEAAVLDYIPDHTWVVLADERIFELRKRFKIKVVSDSGALSWFSSLLLVLFLLSGIQVRLRQVPLLA